MKKINCLKNMDKFLLMITILMSVYGLFNIVTASSREAVTNLDESIFYYFYRHLAILIIGLVASIIVIKTSLKKYHKMLPLIFVITVGLNLWLIIKGDSTRGASNWIDLGFFNLQPSEIAKPVMIVCISFLFEKYYKNLRNPKIKHTEAIVMILLVGLLIPGVVFLQKDLGTAVVLIGIFVVLFLTSPILKQEKFKITVVTLILVSMFCLSVYSLKGKLLSDAQMSRFDFYNPCSKYSKSGYQICNAFIAINDGGLFGVGIGKSTQKYSYIPEPHTDMVFAIISEEMGFLKCTIIFIVYIIILYRILNLSSKTNSIKNRYICLGVATYIFMHIFINLGGLFGVIPLTGVPLPFLSYGGSFTLSLLIALSVVERVHIVTNYNKIKKIE